LSTKSSVGSTQVSLTVPNLIINPFLGITTGELDNLAAETCAYMTIVHPDYSKLAARLTISNLHKQTCDSFMEVVN